MTQLTFSFRSVTILVSSSELLWSSHRITFGHPDETRMFPKTLWIIYFQKFLKVCNFVGGKIVHFMLTFLVML